MMPLLILSMLPEVMSWRSDGVQGAYLTPRPVTDYPFATTSAPMAAPVPHFKTLKPIITAKSTMRPTLTLKSLTTASTYPHSSSSTPSPTPSATIVLGCRAFSPADCSQYCTPAMDNDTDARITMRKGPNFYLTVNGMHSPKRVFVKREMRADKKSSLGTRCCRQCSYAPPSAGGVPLLPGRPQAHFGFAPHALIRDAYPSATHAAAYAPPRAGAPCWRYGERPPAVSYREAAMAAHVGPWCGSASLVKRLQTASPLIRDWMGQQMRSRQAMLGYRTNWRPMISYY